MGILVIALSNLIPDCHVRRCQLIRILSNAVDYLCHVLLHQGKGLMRVDLIRVLAAKPMKAPQHVVLGGALPGRCVWPKSYLIQLNVSEAWSTLPFL